ncbi:unnamed protein product [Vitrella brassicaformis CCMP3155]|uniref:Uncharacterized protein n=2 Tax=Vitrella brassicaformis TaxID=1169539 RepID=A0A0G4GR78_VITBC|nr:unnamed protein product [Vitrella brassicaformis CCMP3155]|eukprot:CEM33038.1 unnamed protein product [Vitrella brassicaformis CCMP3155]
MAFNLPLSSSQSIVVPPASGDEDEMLVSPDEPHQPKLENVSATAAFVIPSPPRHPSSLLSIYERYGYGQTVSPEQMTPTAESSSMRLTAQPKAHAGDVSRSLRFSGDDSNQPSASNMTAPSQRTEAPRISATDIIPELAARGNKQTQPQTKARPQNASTAARNHPVRSSLSGRWNNMFRLYTGGIKESVFLKSDGSELPYPAVAARVGDKHPEALVEEGSVVCIQCLLLATLGLPLIGCCVFILNLDARKGSQRQKWARIHVLSAILMSAFWLAIAAARVI